MSLSRCLASQFRDAKVEPWRRECVPTLVYCLTLLLAAVFNLQTNRAATSPPIVSADAPAEDIAHVRRRSTSVVLGAVTAVILSVIVPQYGQIGLVTIPLWRKLLERAHRRAFDAH